MPETPFIPEKIVVHLGPPNESAQNVTLTFPDYIKNVASSEIYPTWPKEALKANILAQISVAMNRVYTEYYRSQGRDFDITSLPAYDQSFVYQRDIFDTVSEVVDEIFNSYIRKSGFIEPLFATFCDGVKVNCNGLSQWGSVELANSGENYLSILRRYYGDDIEVVRNVEIESIPATAPTVPLREGDTGRDVENIQIRLNRISSNYPAIPKIRPTDGFFGKSTTDAVKEFQRVFSLTDDGIVGSATWYKIQYVYNAVKRLYTVDSEGLKYGELPESYPGELRLGDSSDAVRVLQYYLQFIALYVPTVESVAIDGIYGSNTESSVISFQKTYGYTPSGVVNRAVFNGIQNTYYNTISALDYTFSSGVVLPYPGRVLDIGISGEDVRALQEYLNFIAKTYTEIPTVTPDGIYGERTADAVAAFKRLFNVSGNPRRVGADAWLAITEIYEDLYLGEIVSEGQFPGYTLG